MRIDSSPITCTATPSACRSIPTSDYVNDLFTREAESFIARNDPKPFFLYLNYTVPHAELRAPEDSLAPLKGRFSGDAVRQCGCRRPPGRRDD